ncbi:MAG: hypothetical protein M1288_00770 [Actinobacteria bacterium]|jgi:hypothetical protein|nr:hypothetical protein [Actinomycetota bacterium]
MTVNVCKPETERQRSGWSEAGDFPSFVFEHDANTLAVNRISSVLCGTFFIVSLFLNPDSMVTKSSFFAQSEDDDVERPGYLFPKSSSKSETALLFK